MIAIGRNLTGLTLGILGMGSFVALAFGLVFLKLSPVLVGGLLFGGALVAVSAYRPYLGLHVMLGLAFFEGILRVGDVTFTKVMGGLIMAGWLANSLAQRRIREMFNAQVVAMLAFLAWCAVCVPRAVDSTLATRGLVTYSLLGLSMMMIGAVVDTPERLVRLVFAQAGWTIVASVIALVMYYGGITHVAQGVAGNRNQLAMYINMAVIAALLVYTLIRGTVPRLIILAGVPVLLLALGLTLSRTGLIVMGVTLGSVWYRLARERGFLILLGSTLACVTLFFFLPGKFWARAGTILPSIERQDDTFGMRVRLWETGLRLVEDRPLTGVGPGNFALASARYAEAGMAGMHLNTHNAYVGVAAEEGLPGLALFLTVFLSAMIGVRRGIRAARAAGRTDLALVGITVETMVIAALLTGITMNIEGLKLTWIGLGMCVAFSAIVRKTVAREAPAAFPATPATAVEAGAT